MPGRALNPSVRLLAAAGISFYGDWLTTVALVVLLFRLTHSPIGPAVYMLARVAPRLIGPFPGGALADRYGPARIAASCAVIQAVLTASIVVFAASRLIWPIFLVVALAQFLSSAAQPCYAAMVPRVTGAAGLGRIQGALAALNSSSIMISPAIGALVLNFTAPELLIGIDAATFLVSAALVVTLSRVDNTAAAPALSFGRIAAGFGQDTVVGWLYASVGAGALLGTLPVLRRTPAKVAVQSIVLGTALELVPLAAFAFVTVLPLAMALLFVSGAGATLYQTRGAVGLQQRTPRELVGRTSAVVRFGGYLGMLLGAVAAVSLVQPLGWEATVLIVCAVGATLLFATAVTEGRNPV